jgi:hypothetical protein
MRKFKHKNSNSTVSGDSEKGYKLETGYWLPIWIVENSNDWEEVEEFPKIISFRSLYEKHYNVILEYDGEKCINRSDGGNPKTTISYSTALVDPKCEIYQVAVSETEVFTLGDKVKHPFTDGFDVVSKFIICKDPKKDVVISIYRPDLIGKLVANVGNCFGNCNIEVSKLEKAPEVLFVTEDGVEIFKGDKFYYISIRNPNPVCHSGYAQEESAMNTNYKYFSTIEAAKKYIDENKPIYSKKQVREAIESSFVRENYILDTPCCCADRFKEEIFKQKLVL